ncbi:MAG: hypothetical protein WC629_02110 [Candidatus Paceibacterota bacterium]|jgi:hypothetical protein
MPLEFEEEQYKSRDILNKGKTPKMVSFLIKKGIVKDEKQANVFLVIISIIFLLVSIFIFAYFVFGIRNPFAKQPSPAEQFKNLPPEVRDSLPPEIKAQLEQNATK